MNCRLLWSFVLNVLIVLLTVFATVSMIIGFEFMGDVRVLSEQNFHAFKYFTVDSNVFAGIVSLVVVVVEFLLIKGKIKQLPFFIAPLKLSAVTAVTLTMMTTLCFLAPKASSGYFSLFMNSNLFMHFIVPLLCVVSFVFFEPDANLDFKKTFYGVIPMVLYGIYYSINILTHLENGMTSSSYDWYGFLIGGVKSFPLVIVLIIGVTWGFSVLLWVLNRTFSKA